MSYPGRGPRVVSTTFISVLCQEESATGILSLNKPLGVFIALYFMGGGF